MKFHQRLGLVFIIASVLGFLSSNPDAFSQIAIVLLWIGGGMLFLYDSELTSKDEL